MSAGLNLRELLTRIQDGTTYIVKIDIYPAIVREHKVSNGVCPLYRLGVVVEGAQEPRIFGRDELA